MGFEQAWLNYTERTSCEGADELQYICVDIEEDFRPAKTGLTEFGADELIDNGVRELQNAWEVRERAFICFFRREFRRKGIVFQRRTAA